MISRTEDNERRARRCRWDVIVIGAGPAGAVAARQLALAGAAVLLVDRRHFPRDKVCGGCLSARTVELLDRIGLGDSLRRLGGKSLRRLKLGGWGRSASLSLPGGVSVSRPMLDAALVNAAISAGVDFRPGCHAEIGKANGEFRSVRLRADAGTEVAASLVIDASGLGSSETFNVAHAGVEGRRIGCSAMVDGTVERYEPGTIYMAIGSGGYVGVVRMEDDRLNVAAALDRSFIRRFGAAGAARQIVAAAGFEPVHDLMSTTWSGTPPLMYRPRSCAGERVFAIGDTAGYVEPFTGEGIGWAIHSAVLVLPLALEAIRAWSPSMAAEWTTQHRAELARSQRDCRWLARGLRHPLIARAALRAIASMPALGEPIVRRLHGPMIAEATTWP